MPTQQQTRTTHVCNFLLTRTQPLASAAAVHLEPMTSSLDHGSEQSVQRDMSRHRQEQVTIVESVSDRMLVTGSELRSPSSSEDRRFSEQALEHLVRREGVVAEHISLWSRRSRVSTIHKIAGAIRGRLLSVVDSGVDDEIAATEKAAADKAAAADSLLMTNKIHWRHNGFIHEKDRIAYTRITAEQLPLIRRGGHVLRDGRRSPPRHEVVG